MSISTLDSLQSVRMQREIDQLDSDRIAYEVAAYQDFMHEVMGKPLTSDSKLETRYLHRRYEGMSDRRPAKVWEVMADTLDYDNGPHIAEVMAVLVRVAKAGDADARQLLGRMASTFAKYREEE